MVTSSPKEPHLHHEGPHQAKVSVPCGSGPDPTTPKWALLTDVPTRGKTEAIASLGPKQTGWERPSAPAQCWSPPGEPLSHRQTLDLEDLQCVVLSDSGPWKEDPCPGDKVARAVQAAAGSRQRCPGGLINPDRCQCPSELPMGMEQLCSGCPQHIRHAAAPGQPRGVLEAPSATARASVTHGVRTGSSAGPGSPGRQQQSEIYSAKQPENKPKECLLIFLCGREIKHDCVSPGNAGIPTHGSSAEIASAAGHSQP